MDHDDEFTLTLQTAREPSQLRRIFSTQRLARYINRNDGALAQARIAFRNVEPRCRFRLCNASLALVNSWYRPLRPNLIKRHVREKAVGKITVSLFFLPAKATALAYPSDLQGCEQIVNMQRYYRTCWQSGYMFQKGADLKVGGHPGYIFYPISTGNVCSFGRNDFFGSGDGDCFHILKRGSRGR